MHAGYPLCDHWLTLIPCSLIYALFNDQYWDNSRLYANALIKSSERHLCFLSVFPWDLNLYDAVSGWGKTVGGGSAADILQQAVLPVAEYSTCSRVNGRFFRFDERSMLCAGGKGKGGCQINKPNLGPCWKHCREISFFCHFSPQVTSIC